MFWRNHLQLTITENIFMHRVPDRKIKVFGVWYRVDRLIFLALNTVENIAEY